MVDERKRSRWTIAVVAVALLLAYAVAYLFACDASLYRQSQGGARVYATRQIALAFIPAAWVEAQLTGSGIVLCDGGPAGRTHYIAVPVYRQQ